MRQIEVVFNFSIDRKSIDAPCCCHIEFRLPVDTNWNLHPDYRSEGWFMGEPLNANWGMVVHSFDKTFRRKIETCKASSWKELYSATEEYARKRVEELKRIYQMDRIAKQLEAGKPASYSKIFDLDENKREEV